MKIKYWILGVTCSLLTLMMMGKASAALIVEIDELTITEQQPPNSINVVSFAGADGSNGESLVGGGAKVVAVGSVSIPEEGYYEVHARMANDSSQDNLNVTIGGFSTAAGTSTPGGFGWTKIGTGFLSAGSNSVTISCDSRTSTGGSGLVIRLDALMLTKLAVPTYTSAQYLEADEFTLIDRGPLWIGSDGPRGAATNGYVLYVQEGQWFTAVARVNILEEGYYSIGAHMYNDGIEVSALEVAANGFNVSAVDYAPGSWNWVEIGKGFFSAGYNYVEISRQASAGRMLVDSLQLTKLSVPTYTSNEYLEIDEFLILTKSGSVGNSNYASPPTTNGTALFIQAGSSVTVVGRVNILMEGSYSIAAHMNNDTPGASLEVTIDGFNEAAAVNSVGGWLWTDVGTGSFLPGYYWVEISCQAPNNGNARFDSLQILANNIGPIADAGPDQTVGTGANATACSANVSLDGSGSSDPNGDVLTYTWTWDDGSASGVNPTVVLPVGTTTVTLTVDDGALTATDTVVITVIDTTPPVISGLTASPDCLWSPNHKMINVVLYAAVSDNCSGVITTVITATGVTSDEPTASIRGAGGKVHAPDATKIISGDIVSLRAERSGTGDGRVYEITANVTATDSAGNKTTVTGLKVQVVVPHDEADNCSAVNNGQNYDATKIN